MSKLIDARGRPCPQPVLMTKKAVDAGEHDIEVIVDNEGSAENVRRFAEKEGYQVEKEQMGADIKLKLKREGAKTETSQPAEITCETGTWRINRGQVILIKGDRIGIGSDELGGILVKSLVNTLAENTELPEKIVLINSGVKLVCEGSDLIEAFSSLEKKGVELLACGTCLNYFELQEKIRAGRVSNAFEILNSLLSAERVIDLA
jgi:selenium metabolism protein YedF